MERTKYTERNEFGLPNIVIPAEVLMNFDLSPREMLLFGYLLNMTYNEQGYCWASNRYLSRLLNVTPETISTMLSKLTKNQYLFLEYETRYDGKEVRRIFINKKYPEIYTETLKRAYTKLKRPIRKIIKGLKKNHKGPKENPKEALWKPVSNINNDIDNRYSNISLSDPSGSDDEIEEDNVLPNGQKRPTVQEREEALIPYARKLAHAVRSNKDIKIGSAKIKKWATKIRQLIETDGISIERIDAALQWYGENIGGEYVPVIESGSSFREKFIRLEDAIKRNGTNGKPKSRVTIGSGLSNRPEYDNLPD